VPLQSQQLLTGFGVRPVLCLSLAAAQTSELLLMRAASLKLINCPPCHGVCLFKQLTAPYCKHPPTQLQPKLGSQIIMAYLLFMILIVVHQLQLCGAEGCVKLTTVTDVGC
jgi:hypothetical protein